MSLPPVQWLRVPLLGGLLACGLAGCGDHQAVALKKLTDKGYSLSVAEFVRAAKAGDDQAVRWFVEAGLEPTLADADHHTGLGEAVAAGRAPVVSALVSLGIKLPHEGEPAAQLLRAAVQSRSAEVLRFLIDHQVTGQGLEADSLSPLEVAASLGQREAVEQLLPLSEGREQAALFAAASGGDVAVLSLLIRAGASVLKRQVPSGKTVLILAAENGRTEAVELLFNAGSNRWALDQNGHSALDLAEAGGYSKVVDLLSVEPTAEEREAGCIRLAPSKTSFEDATEPKGVHALDGAVLAANRAWSGDLSSVLALRSCREETVPFVLQEVSDGQAQFLVLSTDKTVTAGPKDAIGETGWYLDRADPEKKPACVAVYHRASGWRLAMLPGVPGRCGRVVAVLQFGPAKAVYEAVPGDKFTLGGAASRHYSVVAIGSQTVQLQALDGTGEKIVLKAGALR